MTFLLVKRGVVFGAVYGLIGMLIILLGSRIAQSLGSGAASATSPTLDAFLEISAFFVGALCGLFLGFLSGASAGLAFGLLVRSSMYRSPGSESRRTLLGALTGAISGLVALAALMALGSPSSLTPLSPLLGWVLFVIVPPMVVFSVVWWETNKLLLGKSTTRS